MIIGFNPIVQINYDCMICQWVPASLFSILLNIISASKGGRSPGNYTKCKDCGQNQGKQKNATL